jgi:hypothetical protein
MKKIILLNSIIFSLFSSSCYAATAEISKDRPFIHQYKFLSDGFNMQNYQSCKNLITKSCSQSATPDCANVVAKNPVCEQLNVLSQTIGAVMAVVFVKQYGKVKLVSQYFTGDGQVEYYFIAASNQLIDTNIDPLKLQASLKQKYQKISLFPVHWGDPKIQLSNNNQQIFDFSMKAHDTCLACKIALSYNLQFSFDKYGKFKSVKLNNIKN